MIDSSGNLVVEYTYDAWGNILSTTGNMAGTLGEDNPFRYRGYIYDVFTSLYFLGSRYYSPEMGRFICADGQLFTGQDMTGNNLFAYCGNNPVGRVDPDGQSWIDAFVGVITGWKVAYAGVGAIAAVDGPLPFGDIAAAAGAALITVAAVFVATYQYATAPKDKVESESIPAPPSSEAIFYGADRYGGEWKYVTGPMTFEEAAVWVHANATAHTYGKSTVWGLYTPYENDAFQMAMLLGNGQIPIFDFPKEGLYPHYHVAGRDLFGTYSHFHVWFGTIKE